MILTCPRCATRYLVDQSLLWTNGRIVECEACRQRWRASGTGRRPEPPPPEPPPPELAPPEPAPAPVTDLADEAEPSPDPRPETALPEPLEEDVEIERMPRFAPLNLDPPQPAGPARAADEEPLSAPALFRTPPKRASSSRYGPPGLGATLASLFLLVVLLGVLVLFRDAIIRVFPALAGVYSALGLSGVGSFLIGAHV